jgi:GT2 family glycosyltransferase
VKFLLADDKFTGPDSLARLVRLLEQGSDVVLASSAVNLIGEQSEFLKARDYLGRDLLEAGGTTARRCLLSGRNQIGEPSVFIFRRSCAGSGFNPSYRLWIDVEFALRVLEQGRFAYTTQPLTAFRMHDRQQTRRLMEENLLWIEHYRLLRDFAGRSWLGREQARQRLFEALYQLRKKPDAPPEVQRALATAIADLGGEAGYTGFRLRRKLCRPLAKLRRYLFPSAASPG